MTFSLTNRRLVIAHNPNSSRASAVQTDVFGRLVAAGYEYETIEVQQASLASNVARLTPLIRPGDIILSAAGDGSAHAVFHTVLAANQPGVELGFLAYGNFNDIPNTFNSNASLRDPVKFLEQARPETAYPLVVTIDGTPLRSALLYVTLGWTAQAAGQFDDPAVRQKLVGGGGGLLKSLWRLGWYYLKTRKSSLLPSFTYERKEYQKTDLLFANGPVVARLFKSGKPYYRDHVFLFRMLDVRRLLTNIPFLSSGLFGRMKGDERSRVTASFTAPLTARIQCDGEVVELKNVATVEVAKATRPLALLVTKER